MQQLTLIDMGIMMEQRSSKRRGIINSSNHGPSSGYLTYHCYQKKKKKNQEGEYMFDDNRSISKDS